MKFTRIIATAAIVVAGAAAANASTLNSPLASFSDISSARSASVLTINANEAKLLGYSNDVDSIRARVQGNKTLLQTIERQGFSLDQIVGASGTENDLTLYAL